MIKTKEPEKYGKILRQAREALDGSDFEDAARYYDAIQLEDPQDWESKFYYAYCKAMDTSLSEMSGKADSFRRKIKSVVDAIEESDMSPDEKAEAVSQVVGHVCEYIKISVAAIDSHLEEFKEVADISEFDGTVDDVASVGYYLGDGLKKYIDGQNGQMYKSAAIRVWKVACEENYVHNANSDLRASYVSKLKELDPNAKTGGCYVATSIYGSYDCPEVWTLRRYRDNVLAKTARGRCFIHAYYAVSPTAVKLFGDSKWFKGACKPRLDAFVKKLQSSGFKSTSYSDPVY